MQLIQQIGPCLALLFVGCTQAQQTQALRDSRDALDKACAVRAVEKAQSPPPIDGGVP